MGYTKLIHPVVTLLIYHALLSFFLEYRASLCFSRPITRLTVEGKMKRSKRQKGSIEEIIA